MTDILDAKSEVTTPPDTTFRDALATLCAPTAYIATQVRRFGIEYEMLQRHHRSDYGAMLPCDDESCEICYDGDPYDEGPCPDARVSRLSTVGRLVAHLAERDLAMGDIHPYHCDCGDCSYSRTWGTLFATQYDSSVGVEFVSRICDATVDSDIDDIEQWVIAMQDWAAKPNAWMPDGHAANGNHIHISALGDDFDWRPEQILAARRLMAAAYIVYDWNNVVDGACGRVRDYNEKPTRDRVGYSPGGEGGSWLCSKVGGETIEHRAWNTPRDPERLWASVGISLALTRWAFQAAVEHPDLTDGMYEHSGRRDSYGYMVHSNTLNPAALSNMHDNIDVVIDGIRAHIPPDPRFDVARTVIGYLATY